MYVSMFVVYVCMYVCVCVCLLSLSRFSCMYVSILLACYKAPLGYIYCLFELNMLCDCPLGLTL